MKFLLPKPVLVSLIGKIQNIISPKPALPILANILLEAIDDQLILSATDLTVSMRAHSEVKVVEEGAITLPARRFFQLVRELTAPQVEIHASSPEIAFINAGSSHFKIHGMHKSEFPTLPDFSDGAVFIMSAKALKDLLSRTSFAAARDDSRQVLNGVLLQNQNGQTAFIGTDGKRLAKVQASSVLTGPEGATSYILPLKAVEEMIRLLDVGEDPVKLTLMADKAALEVNSIVLITKLLSGQYPDVSRVIPDKKTSVALHREELISLLRQVSLFTSESSNSVLFSFTTGNLHLSATSGEIGEGKVNMPVNYAGERLDIAFNPHYFLDILRHSNDETVDFTITDPYNPGLVTDSTSAQFVIMPMRRPE